MVGEFFNSGVGDGIKIDRVPILHLALPEQHLSKKRKEKRVEDTARLTYLFCIGKPYLVFVAVFSPQTLLVSHPMQCFLLVRVERCCDKFRWLHLGDIRL